MEYYVYKHIRKKDGSTFYIGKGKEHRVESDKGRNTHWKRIVKKDGGFDSEIIKDGLSEDEAFNLEVKLISEIGLDNLCNMTEGGSGGNTYTEETRLRISKQFTGRIVSDETRKKQSEAQTGKISYWKGKKRPAHSDKMKQLVKEGVYKDNGKWFPTEETKRKMSEAAKRKKIRRVVCEFCDKELPSSHLTRHQISKNCLGNTK